MPHSMCLQLLGAAGFIAAALASLGLVGGPAKPDKGAERALRGASVQVEAQEVILQFLLLPLGRILELFQALEQRF